MTQSDVRNSGSAADGKAGIKSPTGRRRGVVAAAAAIAVAGVVGTTAYLANGGDDDEPSSSTKQPPPSVEKDDPFLTGKAPTAELVQGLWRVDNDNVVYHFGADGIVRVDNLGSVYAAPAMTGTYTLDGDEIRVTTTASHEPGCIGEWFTVRASLPKAGSMHFVVADESPSSCFPTPPSVLEQLLPTNNKGVKTLIFSTVPDWAPFSGGRQALLGLWMAERGGHIVEIADDGSYLVADDSAESVDRGTWALRGSDLVLTSSGDSAACNAGDRLVLADMEMINLGTSSIRGTVRENTCGGAWTPAAWFLIPHLGS